MLGVLLLVQEKLPRGNDAYVLQPLRHFYLRPAFWQTYSHFYRPIITVKTSCFLDLKIAGVGPGTRTNWRKTKNITERIITLQRSPLSNINASQHFKFFKNSTLTAAYLYMLA